MDFNPFIYVLVPVFGGESIDKEDRNHIHAGIQFLDFLWIYYSVTISSQTNAVISFSMLVYSVLLLYMLWLWFYWCQDKVLIASRKVSFCLVIIIALHNCTSLKTFTI